MKIVKRNKLCLIISLVAIIIILFTNTICAANLNEIYNTGGDDGDLNQAAGKVLGVVQVIGYSVAVIMLTYMGIKFLYSSPEGKANLKKELIPYIIGIFILFAGATIATLIAKQAREINDKPTAGGNLVLVRQAEIDVIKM